MSPQTQTAPETPCARSHVRTHTLTHRRTHCALRFVYSANPLRFDWNRLEATRTRMRNSPLSACQRACVLACVRLSLSQCRPPLEDDGFRWCVAGAWCVGSAEPPNCETRTRACLPQRRHRCRCRRQPHNTNCIVCYMFRAVCNIAQVHVPCAAYYMYTILCLRVDVWLDLLCGECTRLSAPYNTSASMRHERTLAWRGAVPPYYAIRSRKGSGANGCVRFNHPCT